MLKAIANFSVKYPVSVSMIIFATLLLGYISFDKLGIDLFPDLNTPRLYVELVSGERPPEEMESRYVDRVESIAIRQSGVVNVSSVSQIGVAQVEVEYDWNKDMNEAFLDLSKALSSFNQDEELDEINILQRDPNADPVMLVAFRHRDISDLNEARKVAEDYVRNELIRLEGIADVEIDGAEELEVLVETNDYLLKSYNIELQTISSRIESYNQNISGGSITESGKRYIIRGLSELQQIEDLKEIILRKGSGTTTTQTTTVAGEDAPVLLRDVATVTVQSKDPQNAVLYNGVPAIGLSIYKEMRYNTVKAVEDLKNELVQMEKALPGYSFTVIEDQGKFISGAIGEVRDSALAGILLAVFVLFIFLKRIGPTAIVSAAIPISIIATFSLMYFAHLTLNIMTLGGLALGAGMLVDNAIVVLENIFRNHETGKSVNEAAVTGTAEVGGAITASTFTTIVVFIPIVFMHGASGELFKDQAFTVAFSLLCSLIVAILIIPMLYSRFYLRRSPFRQGRIKGSIQFKGYSRLLDKILKYRVWILVMALLLIISGWFMMKKVGSEFMPAADVREFYIDVEMPEGTGLERTVGAVTNIEAMIRELAGEDVKLIYSEIGQTAGLSAGGTNLFSDQNRASLKVILKRDGKLPASALIGSITTYFENNEEIKLMIRQEESALQSILGTDEEPVVIELIGEDMDVLEPLTNDVMNELMKVDGLRNINTSIEGGAPEVNIAIDRYRAGLMNIDVNTIINTISEKLQGVNAGQMEVKGDLTDITVRMSEISLNDLEMMPLEVNNSTILLSEVASIEIGNSPREILHNNQNRVIRITAELERDIPLDRIAGSVEQHLSSLQFPANCSYRITGEEALRKESMKNLLFALLLSVILVYMVLAAQFESLVHPFTILLTIPFAVVGSLAVFIILGSPLNIMAVIGIIMLVGIAVNDSIILVDAINQFRREGVELREAIIFAGQRRIRPIIMTSLTTILALLPLTFGFGESAALRSPMAWAVIGGLVTSTLLTLVVIPCIYLLFGEIGNKGSKTSKSEA